MRAEKWEMRAEETIDEEGNVALLLPDGTMRYPLAECRYCHHQQEVRVRVGAKLKRSLAAMECENCGRKGLEVLEEFVTDITWDPPRRLIECEPDELYQDVRGFIKENVDFRFSALYDLCAAWAFHTWFLPYFRATTHLLFVGVTKTGKTRALETLKSISYRGELGVSLTQAALFRSIDKKKITPFISEYQDLRAEEKVEIDAVIKGGQKRGEIIWRSVITPSKDYDVLTFDPFTAMAIGTQFTVREDIANRCFQIKMEEAVRRVSKFVDYEKAQFLKEQLCYLRFFTPRERIEECMTLADAWLEKEKIWGREYERYLPLLTMFYLCGVPVEKFRELVEYDREHQRETAQKTLDAIIIQELIGLFKEEQSAQLSLGAAARPTIKMSLLHERLVNNEEVAEISPRKLRVLLDHLNITVKRRRDGAYIEDEHLEEKLKFYDKRFALGEFERVERMPELDELIYSHVLDIEAEDRRGALIDLLVKLISERGFAEAEVRGRIEEMIEEGNLILYRDETGEYVKRG